MKSHIVAAAATIGLGFAAVSAEAATLGLTTGTPIIEASFAEVEYFEDTGFGFGDLSAFFVEVDFTDGISLEPPAFIDFVASFDLAEPTFFPIGGFSVFEDFSFDFALGGDLLDIGYTEDTVELLFGDLIGSKAAEFNKQVLMTIAFDDQLGVNPFDAFVDGDIYTASLQLANVVPPQVIPLPAGAVLLLSGLAGFGLMRRRQAQDEQPAQEV